MSVASTSADPFDLVLVGGGLQNGLIALCVLRDRPESRIAMVEAAPEIGGNHTWCVHAQDVTPTARAWFEPLVVRRWPGYHVSFPDRQRHLASSYAVVSSENFARVVTDTLSRSAGCQLFTRSRATHLTRQQVQLEDGRSLCARLVIDARGPDPHAFVGQCGYQKFLGLELEMRAPHGLTEPILMDARCAQTDGYRFFYVLPLATERLLVEETRFSPTPQLDCEDARSAVHAYAARFGTVAHVAREETGVLPMPWSTTTARETIGEHDALRAGYRGGYFHPATGYSLPAAVRAAEAISQSLREASGAYRHGELLGASWDRFVRMHHSQSRYALQLNRLLFTGFAETDMWGVLSRFYGLSEPLIERFYAQSSSLTDRARILIGRPPRGFSLRRALSARALSAGVA